MRTQQKRQMDKQTDKYSVSGRIVGQAVAGHGGAKDGFTLVELIVVLVVLAILAAITIPALLGYIDRSNEKKVIMNGQSAYVAAQTLTRESYGEAEAWPTKNEVKELSDVPGTVIEMWIDANAGKVVATTGQPFRYQEGDIIAVCIDGEWSVPADGGGSGEGGVIGGSGSGSGGSGGGSGTDTPDPETPSTSAPVESENNNEQETEPATEQGTITPPDGQETVTPPSGGDTGTSGNPGGSETDEDDEEDDEDDEEDEEDDKEDDDKTTGSYTVKLEDTSGETHEVCPMVTIENLRKSIEEQPTSYLHIPGGTVIGDETGIYMCLANETISVGLRTFNFESAEEITCALIVDKCKNEWWTNFIRLDEDYELKIWTDEDVWPNGDTSVNRSINVEKGQMYYSEEEDKLYVAICDFLFWTNTPPLSQNGLWQPVNTKLIQNYTES